MVKYLKATAKTKITMLDYIADSLATPIRRDILQRVSKETLSVTEIAKSYDVSLPAISKNIKVLEKAGLLKRHKNGKEYHFTFNPDPLQKFDKYLHFYRQFWNVRFESLEVHFEQNQNKKL